jgi:hypothetical protein
MKKIFLIVLLLIVLNGCDLNTYKTYLNKSQDTIYQGDTYIDKGAYLLVGFTRYEMTTEDSIDSTILGVQDLQYFIEYDGKTYSIRRRVMVVKSNNINVFLKPGIDTISVGSQWTDAGIESENTIAYEVKGIVDINTIGTYVIEYIVTYEDETFSLIRYVNVV